MSAPARRTAVGSDFAPYAESGFVRQLRREPRVYRREVGGQAHLIPMERYVVKTERPRAWQTHALALVAGYVMGFLIWAR